MDFETKAITPDIKHAFDDFLSAFEAFKEANDTRLAELETRSADVLTEEKVDRINRALDEHKRVLDELSLASQRPVLGGEKKHSPQAREQKAAFERYVRGGDASGLIEMKAMSISSNADGGYTVPLEIEQTIDRVLTKVSPMRSIATVRQIGSNVYRKPIASAGITAGWLASETTTPTQTNTPTLAAIDFPTMELYAMPAATQNLLDDNQVDLEAWLAEEVQTVFAEQEGAAFVSGNGTSAPKGFLTETKVADGAWSWGNLGYIATGVDAAFPATTPTDALITLAYAPKQGYRANATWVMNRKTESVIRKFKDAQNGYIWQPGSAAGQPATLLGYPVAEAEDMPDIASGSYSIGFGDFRRGYLIVDRIGVKVLRDPYSAKPYVLFYTTKRVGGGVQNFEAIKLMKFAAS